MFIFHQKIYAIPRRNYKHNPMPTTTLVPLQFWYPQLNKFMFHQCSHWGCCSSNASNLSNLIFLYLFIKRSELGDFLFLAARAALYLPWLLAHSPYWIKSPLDRTYPTNLPDLPTVPNWVPFRVPGSPWGPFCGFGSPLGLLFCLKVPFFSILG